VVVEGEVEVVWLVVEEEVVGKVDLMALLVQNRLLAVVEEEVAVGQGAFVIVLVLAEMGVLETGEMEQMEFAQHLLMQRVVEVLAL